MNFINQYLEESKNIIDLLDKNQIVKMVNLIKSTRDNKGRMVGTHVIPIG